MARTDSLGHFLTDVADAIRTKGGTSATIQASSFDTAIANLPSGGGTIEPTEKDVNFYDYDGTRVYTYTKADFLQLSALPNVPTHDGLISQGWNWTLSDAKTFVTTYNKLDIGPYYITSDNATRIYIRLNDTNRLNPCLGLNLTGTATIDWGDNSSTDSVTSNDISTTIRTQHTYSSVGDYVVSITGGDLYLSGATTANSSYLFTIDSTSASYANCYLNSIYKIEIGDNIKNYGFACFAHLHNLKSITIPSNSVNMSSNYEFYYCSSLKFVTFPNSSIIPQYCFSDCSALEIVSFSKSVISTNSYVFAKCYSLLRCIIPTTNITTLGSTTFQYCYSLKEVIKVGQEDRISQTTYSNCVSLTKYVAPSTLTRIDANAFNSCVSMKIYDFSAITSVPTLASTSAFNNIASDCIMIIPDSLYSTWSTASIWSSFASHMIKASEA